jgi:phage-related protein
VFYIAKFDDAIYVLHAFQKKSGKTREADLRIGRRRLAEVTREQLERRKK